MFAESSSHGLWAFAASTALHAALLALPVCAFSSPPPSSPVAPPPVLVFTMNESPSSPAFTPAPASEGGEAAQPEVSSASPERPSPTVAHAPVSSSLPPPSEGLEDDPPPTAQPWPEPAFPAPPPADADAARPAETARDIPPPLAVASPVVTAGSAISETGDVSAHAVGPLSPGAAVATSGGRADGTGATPAALVAGEDGGGRNSSGRGLPSSRTGAPETVFGRAQAPGFRTRVSPVYPDRERRAGIEGRVSLRLWIDESGVLREAEVLASDAESFTDAALKALRASTYVPARNADGRAFTSRALLTLRFRLETRR